MALTSRWTGRGESELVGTVRMQCYAAGLAELPKFIASVLDDPRARDGEFLVVEKDGRAVGTATSHHLTLHTHGASFPCQGVAYVGTIRTERRKSAPVAGGAREPGIATSVMRETIKRGRDRDDVVSALMPFRASFYEHFGYGLVERQANWVLPMSVLPSEGGGNWSFLEPSMMAELVHARNLIAAGGNCDIERSVEFWNLMLKRTEGGFTFVDRDEFGICGWVTLLGEPDWTLRAVDWGVRGPREFKRLLALLASMKDQHGRVLITTPIDWQINRLLKESQVPHRQVAHPTATMSVVTRMQIRVLDHVRFLSAVHWPIDVAGEAVVSIRETEGHESRLRVRVENGRAEATPTTASPTLTATDSNYASIVSGEISASNAVAWGLAEGDGRLWDALARGRRPFTHEYF